MSKHEESSRKSWVAVRSVTFWQEKFQRSRYFGQRRLKKKILENRGKGVENTDGSERFKDKITRKTTKIEKRDFMRPFRKTIRI